MLNPSGIPEFYADLVQIALGEAGIFLGFRAISPLEITSPEEDDPDSLEIAPLRAIVRLSPENAKVFAIMLKRSLKTYEDEAGPIPLPREFMEIYTSDTDEW